VVSDLMDIELERAPEQVKNLLYNYPNECFEGVSLTKEAQELGKCMKLKKWFDRRILKIVITLQWQR
jgi:hypothetical protein